MCYSFTTLFRGRRIKRNDTNRLVEAKSFFFDSGVLLETNHSDDILHLQVCFKYSYFNSFKCFHEKGNLCVLSAWSDCERLYFGKRSADPERTGMRWYFQIKAVSLPRCPIRDIASVKRFGLRSNDRTSLPRPQRLRSAAERAGSWINVFISTWHFAAQRQTEREAL